MIFLIGGAPDSGKSSLAQELAKKEGAQVIELDLLMPGFNALISTEEFSAKLPVWQAKKEDREPAWTDYLTEAATYWSSIKPILNNLLRFRPKQNFVVEGTQLSPELLRPWLENLDEKEFIKVVFLDGGDHPLNNTFSQIAKKCGFEVIKRAKRSSQ